MRPSSASISLVRSAPHELLRRSVTVSRLLPVGLQAVRTRIPSPSRTVTRVSHLTHSSSSSSSSKATEQQVAMAVEETTVLEATMVAEAAMGTRETTVAVVATARALQARGEILAMAMGHRLDQFLFVEGTAIMVQQPRPPHLTDMVIQAPVDMVRAPVMVVPLGRIQRRVVSLPAMGTELVRTEEMLAMVLLVQLEAKDMEQEATTAVEPHRRRTQLSNE